MNKIQWKRSSNHTYTSYAYINGKAISFEVFSNGSYKGYSPNYYGNDPRRSNPNLFITGSARDVESAMDSVEDFYNSLIKSEEPCEIKKEPEIISIVEDVIPCVLEGTTVDFKEFETKKTNEDKTINDLSLSYEKTENDEFLVTLLSANNNKIKYTTDGKEISNFSKVYKEPFVVVSGALIKAKSFNELKEEVGSVEITL